MNGWTPKSWLGDKEKEWPVVLTLSLRTVLLDEVINSTTSN